MQSSDRRTWWALILAGAGVVSLVTQAAAQDDPPDLFRYYFKERLPLQLDTTRIACHVDQGTPGWQAADQVLRRAGFERADPQPLPLDDWTIYQVPQYLRDAASVTQSIRGLAQQVAPAFLSPVFLDDWGGVVIPTPRILTGFVAEVEPAQRQAVLDQLFPGAAVRRLSIADPPTLLVSPDLPTGLDVLDAANALAVRPDVRFAEPSFFFTGHHALIPNDPGFPSSWGLHNTGQTGGTPDMDMDAPEAWDITTGDPNVIIVVFDVGIQRDHPDLNLLDGFDFTGQGGGGEPVNVCDNHGTLVAGCITAAINNKLGTVGIAPNCRTVSARIGISNVPCNGTWTGSNEWTVQALSQALRIGARVTNNSNYYFSCASISNAYEITRNRGMIHFAASGNNGPAITCPANLSTVHAIGAVDHNGNRASFSNAGNGLSFAAPGVAIYTTDRTGVAGWCSGDYCFVNGTSFASPFAAGVAALVLSMCPDLTVEDLDTILTEACVDLGSLGHDPETGWGFINAAAAVAAAQAACGTTCYADCDGSGTLDIFDFLCFQNSFVNAEPYACECDPDPACNIFDFLCFQSAFVSGCP